MPLSTAFCMIAKESASLVDPPKFMVPRHKGETITPERPSFRYSMAYILSKRNWIYQLLEYLFCLQRASHLPLTGMFEASAPSEAKRSRRVFIATTLRLRCTKRTSAQRG